MLGMHEATVRVRLSGPVSAAWHLNMVRSDAVLHLHIPMQAMSSAQIGMLLAHLPSCGVKLTHLRQCCFEALRRPCQQHDQGRALREEARHAQVPPQCCRRHTERCKVQEEQALQCVVTNVRHAPVHQPLFDLQSGTHSLQDSQCGRFGRCRRVEAAGVRARSIAGKQCRGAP